MAAEFCSKGKVSVVVPVYNAEATICRCVNSIINQSYKNIEIILVDDGSADKSLCLCELLAQEDSRIRVIHQVNSGVSHARNVGIKKSRGEWLMFVDSDDFLSENVIDNLMGNECDLSYCSIVNYSNEDGKVESSFSNFKESRQFDWTRASAAKIIEDVDLLGIGFPWGKIFKRSVIERNGIKFDERIRNHEDHLFVFDYLVNAKSVYLDTRSIYYWTHSRKGGSLSGSLPKFEDLVIVSDEFLRRFDMMWEANHSISQHYRSRIISEYGLGTRRRAVYSLYKYSNDKKERTLFLIRQQPIFKSLLSLYGYKTRVTKHRIIFHIVACSWLPAFMKDIFFSILYGRNNQ